MPCLTYMLSGESLEAHKTTLAGIQQCAGLEKIVGDPQYKDNVSGIISIMLKRTAASQI